MLRRIEGFHQDEDGDWVAELSCLHGQHVRHEPPFTERPWVQTAEGRASRVDSEIECPLCDRAELPEGLELVRTAGPFDETTLPAALRRDHVVAEHTWAIVRVVDGEARFTMATEPPLDRVMRAGEQQAIPPATPHAVHVDGPMTIAVDFFVRPTGE